MWLDSRGTAAVRYAAGIPTSPLWLVAFAKDTSENSAGRPDKDREGLFLVFDNVCAFRRIGHDELAAAEHRWTRPPRWTPNFPTYKWPYEGVTEFLFGETTHSVEIVPEASPRFKLQIEFGFGSVANALKHLHRRPTMTIPLEEPESVPLDDNAAIMYPDLTKCIRDPPAKYPSPTGEKEYVVFESGGAVFTNCRIRRSTVQGTHNYWLPEILMLRRGQNELVLIHNKEENLVHIPCHTYLQNKALRLWLATIYERMNWGNCGRSFSKCNYPQRIECVQVLERLYKQFCNIDVSGNGSIELDELESAVGPVFSCNAFIASFFRALDIDRDGFITFAEFADGMMAMLSEEISEKTEFFFRVFDINRDGRLSQDEVYGVLKSLESTGNFNAGDKATHETTKALFAMIDTNRDGSLSHQEFSEALKKNGKVHDLLRKVGFATFSQRSKLTEDIPIGIGDEDWILCTALTQALLHSMNQVRAAYNEVPSAKKQRAIFGKLSAADFSAVLSESASIPFELIEKVGSLGVGRVPTNIETNATHSEVTTFAPKVFGFLRALFGVQASDLRQSFGLRSPAANMLVGCVDMMRRPAFDLPYRFAFVSGDNRFILFSLTSEQRDELTGFLHQYVDYIKDSPDTLLPRFCGVHSIRNDAYSLDFAIALNPIQSPRPIQGVFSLKGLPSRRGKGKLLCEADLSVPVKLGPGWRKTFLNQVAKDAGFLHACGLSGYTLLMSLERIPAKQEKEAPKKEKASGFCSCCGDSPTREPISESHEEASTAEEIPKVEGTISEFTSIFEQFQGGIPSFELGPVRLAFGNILGDSDADEATRNGGKYSPPASPDDYYKDFQQYLSEWITGEDDLPVEAAGKRQHKYFSVMREQGKPGFIAIDKPQRLVVLANASAEPVRLLRLQQECKFSPSTLDPGLMPQKGAELLLLSKLDGVYAALRAKIKFESAHERRQFMDSATKALQTAVVGGMPGVQTSTIRVSVVTWNVGDKPPADNFAVLFPNVSQSEVICVAAQECNYSVKGNPTATCEENFFARVTQALPEHCVAFVESLWTIRMCVLVRQSMAHRVTNVVFATEATGIGHVMGNKGGIAVGLRFDNSTIAFVGSHLAAHLEHVEARNSDYREIIEGVSSDLCGSTFSTFLNAYHHVFWCGDLNYRIQHEFEDVVEKSYKGEFSSMLQYDQLIAEHRKGTVFCGFDEPPPNFAPTYRFLRNTDAAAPRVYDDWKHRVPSWCDRVLHKALGNPLDTATRVAYDVCHDVRSSDHSPVFATFDVKVRGCYDPPEKPVKVTGITISNLRCRGLRQADRFGLSDPYVKFVCPFFKETTDVTRAPAIDETLDPVWEDTFSFETEDVDLLLFCSEYLTFVVKDKDALGSGDPLGEAVCSFHICEASPNRPQSVKLPVCLYGIHCGTLEATLTLSTQ